MPDQRRPQDTTIVFVDDDDEVRRSFSFMLRARGFSVMAYGSGTDLLSRQTQSDTDCLLIDYRMPGMNGIVLLDALRKVGWGQPALMITGDPNPSLRERALEAGFLAIIDKPVKPSTLSSCIEMAVFGKS